MNRLSDPTVCMVTGTYAPEVSGGSLQGRTLAVALKPRIRCVVLTTTTDSTLQREDVVDDIPVYRVYVEPRNLARKVLATFQIVRRLLMLRHEIDIIHMHGFSQKNWPVVCLNLWLRKPMVQKLTLLGTDDPASLRNTFSGRIQRWCYAQADRLIAVSPALMEAVQSDSMLRRRVQLIANGVDVARFSPVPNDERRTLRQHLGFPPDAKVVLFVGIAAPRKDPLTVWRAWRKIQPQWGGRLRLLMIGATDSPYYEIDPSLVAQLRDEVRNAGCADQVSFLEGIEHIEAYFQAADLFVHSSRDEGLPNAVLEAMATGLPCIVARLRGITDWIIEDGVSGVLVEPGDVGAFAQTMLHLLEDAGAARALGMAARHTIQQRFGMDQIAISYEAMYRELRNGRHEEQAVTASH